MSSQSFVQVNDLKVEFAGRRQLFRAPKPPVKAVNGVTFSINQGKTFGGRIGIW